MGYFDELKKSKPEESKPVVRNAEDGEGAPKKTGYTWVTQLIKWDLEGNAEIVRSFAKHAKDSDIKQKFFKKKEDKVSLNISEDVNEENLFGD